MKTKTRKPEGRLLVILERGDFSAHGLDLGIWEALTEGMPPSTTQIEVLSVRAAN